MEAVRNRYKVDFNENTFICIHSTLFAILGTPAPSVVE